MDNKKNGIPKLRFPGFTGAWEQRKLGEITKTHSFKQYISEAFDHGKYMVIQQGENPIAGYANGDPFENFKDVTLFGDHTLSLFKPQEKFFVASDGIKILSPSLKMNGMFYYYLLEKYRPQSEGYKRHFTIMKKSTALFPIEIDEQIKISNFLKELDSLIALHQRKLEHLQEQKKGLLQKMFPKNGETVPEVRFPGFTDAWEQRKLGEEFKRVNERNNGEFGKDRWISVAKMYFQDPDKVTSNNIDTRTYVMRFGDIAFEGHPNNEFKFGRFVANDIGDGVVSELFPIYRHIRDYDNNYWKYAIHLERIMGPIFAKSITSSGNSSNKLAPKDLLRQSIFLPHLDEQKEIGNFLKKMDSLITLHQRKLDHLELMKKGLLQQMFV
ncbi:MAG: restriction endonuclease subunit S [Lactobacillus sp.]|nr:restriction endonuclease subunit S [Lactobacillus sp.]